MVTLPLRSTPTPAQLVRHARAAHRLRLAVPGLVGQPALARRIELELRAHPGVQEARADARSGRILIRYAEDGSFLAKLRGTAAPSVPARPRAFFRWPLSGTFARGVHGTPVEPTPWHALPVDAVLARVEANRNGLDAREAARRLLAYGPNALPAPESRSRLEILVSQVANLPAWLLLGSSALSALLQDFFDATAILSAVGLNTVIGYEIERANEDLLSSWRQLEAGTVEVLRDGLLRTVPATGLVVGDLLLCRAGDRLPADARAVDAHRLACNEALLTGESEPQAKSAEPVDVQAALAERSSMVYAGTAVASGHGRVVITATGAATEVARVGQLLSEQRAPETPLERRLRQLGNQLTFAGVGAGVASACVGVLRGRPLAQVMRSAIALGVAAIPEGLPIVSTAALVRSMQRMRRRGMVVRRLASAETLGGVTVVCADQTGTLTQNDMTLEVIDLGDGPIAPATVRAVPDRLFTDGPTLALAAAVLNSDVDVQRNRRTMEIFGSSTERALVLAATAAGLDRASLRRAYPRRALRERDSGVHYVISLHDAPDGGAVAFVKGAPEQVLALCQRDLHGRLHAAGRARVRARNAVLAAAGLRVLALGWRRLARAATPTEAETGYTLIGLVGLRDPLRPGSAEALRSARHAGIRTIILTGDQQRTATAIARAVELDGETVDGLDVPRLLAASPAEMRARLDRIAVFSRVAPADKVAIVKALRASGEIVAMAGDGINDAPALKAADVGIAIGIRSSDVARQAADVVLENEDLRSILSAVGEGRIVQDNLRRMLRFMLATNFSESALTLGAAIVGAADPFTPLQLLWVNLLSETLPALALALEPGKPDVLNRAPAPPDAPLMPARAARTAIRDGLLLTGLGAASLAIGGPAMAFSTMVGTNLGYPFACRSTDAAPDRRFFTLISSGVALQVAALAFPPLRGVLGLPQAFSLLEVAGFAAGMGLPWVTAGVMGGVSADEVIVRKGNGAVAVSRVAELRSQRRTTHVRAPISRAVAADHVRKMEVMR